MDLPGIRFWTVCLYLIVYRPDPRPIEMVRVLHGARDIAAVLGVRALTLSKNMKAAAVRR